MNKPAPLGASTGNKVMSKFFIAVPAKHRTAIFGAGTTAEAAIADAVRWGDPSDKPAAEVWEALAATETLHNLVLSAGAPSSWSEVTVGAHTLQCTTDEADAVEIAADILRAVGESVDGGSDLSDWTGEEAIDAELADWRAQAA